jgi:hypothetical protein
MVDFASIISDIFVGNGAIIVIGCFIVGLFLKGSVKKLPNKYIPYINSITAIILGFLIPDTYSDKPIATKIILLAFLGITSVGLYESICNAVQKRFSINLSQIINNIINPKEENSDEKNYELSSQTPEDVPHDND